MRAIVYTRYGSPDDLSMVDVNPPVPFEGEVLVRTLACAVNYSDWAFVHGKSLLVRIHPSPRAETSRRLGPNKRFCIFAASGKSIRMSLARAFAQTTDRLA